MDKNVTNAQIKHTASARTLTNPHNPPLPLSHHIPDGEAHVMPDGKLYIYGSYDAKDDFYCSNVYHVASTPDLVHWTVGDISLRAEDIPWFRNPDYPHYPGLDWSDPTPYMQKMLDDQAAKADPDEIELNAPMDDRIPPLLYAPDCAYKNGKYYLYFCMSDESEGVAVSDSPMGPFTDPVQLPCGQIDPAVFVDDDGSAYYYWGQFRSFGVKLNEDMVSFNTNAVVKKLVTEEDHFFHEGSSMRKIGDTYYYVFADVERGRPTALGYATGPSPLGPFTYRGIIIDNDGCDKATWNNHGSIECVNGQWYVFYHRSSRGDIIYRRLCIEPIEILPDGSIPEVKMTSQGAGAPFGSGEAISGFRACTLRGELMIAPEDEVQPDGWEVPLSLPEFGGYESLQNIADGDEAVFRYVKSESGFKRAVLHTRGKGTVTVLLDGGIAGCAELSPSGETSLLLNASSLPGRSQELTLRFSGPDALTVLDITLFD